MSICGDVNSIVYDLFCCRNEKFQTNENDNCCFHENSLKLVKIKRVIWTRSLERTSKMNISISHNLRKCKNGNGISVLPWTDSSKIAVLGNLNIYHTIQCIELNCIECFPKKCTSLKPGLSRPFKLENVDLFCYACKKFGLITVFITLQEHCV